MLPLVLSGETVCIRRTSDRVLPVVFGFPAEKIMADQKLLRALVSIMTSSGDSPGGGSGSDSGRGGV